MNNIIKQKFKHGIFSYYKNDQYIGKSLSEYGEWSEPEIELLKQVFPNEGNIVEIGSNIGTHTVPLANHITNGGKLIAFEPQTQNYNLLIQNLSDNNLNNVKVFKIALSSKELNAYIPIYKEDEINNFGDAEILADVFTEYKQNFERINVKSLDQIINEEYGDNFPINLIKCDAQGQELNIILGSKKIINKYKPFLYLENDDIDISKNLIELIKSMGYRMFWHLPPLFNPNNFMKNNNNIFTNLISCNMFCVHHRTEIELDKNLRKFEIINSSDHPFKNKI